VKDQLTQEEAGAETSYMVVFPGSKDAASRETTNKVVDSVIEICGYKQKRSTGDFLTHLSSLPRAFVAARVVRVNAVAMPISGPVL